MKSAAQISEFGEESSLRERVGDVTTDQVDSVKSGAITKHSHS